jgi:hypothetical protein
MSSIDFQRTKARHCEAALSGRGNLKLISKRAVRLPRCDVLPDGRPSPLAMTKYGILLHHVLT